MASAVRSKSKKAASQSLSERQLSKIAQALAEPRRVRILKELGQSQAELACSALSLHAEVSAPTVSHHLKELENAGLVELVRKGKFVHAVFQREVLEAYLEELSAI